MRRALIIASVSGWLVLYAGVLPTQVPAFGIDLSNVELNRLTQLGGTCIAYFLASFLVYAAADFGAWHARLTRSSKHYADHHAEQASKPSAESLSRLHAVHYQLAWKEYSQRLWIRHLPAVAMLRILLDYVVPVVLGIVVAWALFATPGESLRSPQTASEPVPVENEKTGG